MSKTKTILKFIGGINKDRIGGNCSVIEHTDEKGQTECVMFDLGSIFTPFESGFMAAYPNVDEYFDRVDPKTHIEYKAQKPVQALFLTHAHEDHIGALINYVKMGYKLPPMKASGFTRNFIRLAFKEEGMDIPNIEKVKAGEVVNVGKNISVAAVNVSHSIVDSLGFQTVTYAQGKPYAAIMNNGDFLTEEEMPVGNAFSEKEYIEMLQGVHAPTKVICVDSTSTTPGGKERIGFEQAVENTLRVINANPQRHMIVSPVISRSVQNIAIDIEAARRMQTQIYLDGKWLRLVKQAMSLSGYTEFDDVIYKGTLQGYLGDKRIPRKYVVCTGAFAQGMENYEFNVGIDETSPIPMSAATKMALDLHPYIHVNDDMLVLARQRIIEEINGRTGPAMLQKMAAQGAKVVMTPGQRPVGGFEQIQMQDSGHANAKAIEKLMTNVKDVLPDVIVVPIHGNPEQCENTKAIMDKIGVKTYLTGNLESLEVGKGTIKAVDAKVTPLSWYAVRVLMPNPFAEREIPLEGLREYWEVDEKYKPLQKICEASNGQRFPLRDKVYNNHRKKIEQAENMPYREKMGKPSKSYNDGEGDYEHKKSKVKNKKHFKKLSDKLKGGRS